MSAEAASRDQSGDWRRGVRSLSGIAGICYTVAWIASLTVGPSPSPGVTGAQLLAAYAGHDGSGMANFVLTEGVTAVFLAIVVLLTARAARRVGARRAALAVAGFGLVAAAMSWAELAMGGWVIFGPVASRQAASAGSLFGTIDRVDGSKMFVLAAMAVTLTVLAAAAVVLPRWLASFGLLLAAALVVSGLGFVTLSAGLSDAVNVSAPLLLVVVTATGVTLRTGAARH
jgi:hypothetical protein